MIKIAYIITAHHHPEQLFRLINRLDSEGVSFLIHINKNMEEMYRTCRETLADRQNCIFVKRVPLWWGDFGMVRALLNSIKEICERALDVDFVINLSGQDYPIKTNEKIKEILAQYVGHQLMEYFPLPCKTWGENGGRFRYERFHFWVFGRRFRFVPSRLDWLLRYKRQLPYSLTPYGGSAWWCFSKECIDYLNNFAHSKQGMEVCAFFKHTIGSSEIFFQTVILNSPLANTVINREMSEINWTRAASRPNVWTKDDIGQLKDSGLLFARKFDPVECAEILDLLDEEVLSCDKE
jgi:hypothetical protein